MGSAAVARAFLAYATMIVQSPTRVTTSTVAPRASTYPADGVYLGYLAVLDLRDAGPRDARDAQMTLTGAAARPRRLPWLLLRTELPMSGSAVGAALPACCPPMPIRCARGSAGCRRIRASAGSWRRSASSMTR